MTEIIIENGMRMEGYTPSYSAVQSPFLPGTKLQFAWDSTSLGYLKTCARMYQYILIDGWGHTEESVHLRFGSEFHTAHQDYALSRAAGIPHDDSVFDVVKALLERTADYKPDPDTRAGKYKSRNLLIRSVIWYLDEHRDDPAKTYIKADGEPAVELSFRFELDWGPINQPQYKPASAITPGGPEYSAVQPYLLCGHLDKVVDFNGSLFVMDHKAQPLSASVLGLHGWIQIRHLSIGDSIAGQDGKFYPVKGLYPKGKTKVYRVVFNDNSSVLCGEDHLWLVSTQVNDGWNVLSVKEMLQKPYYVKYHVPLVKPIQHLEAQLPVDPYVLGALLGDGYLNGGSVSLSTTKGWLLRKVASRLAPGEVITSGHFSNNSWTIKGGSTLNGLRRVGLWKTLSRTKFIPDEYMFASEDQRRELLQGLLDTDGSWNGRHRIYDSMGLQLTKDICNLVRSLGGTARYRDRNDGCYRTSIRMEDLPSGLGKRFISDIFEVDEDETMCIEIDSPDHLYVAENYTVTHNTSMTTLGDRYFDQWSPSNQMTLYTLASRIILDSPVKGVIINAAQLMLDYEKSGEYGARFVRGITYRTPDQLAEWLDDLKVLLAQAESYAENNFWPMNDTSCDKFGGCRFRSICSKSPQVREQFLKSDFEKLDKDQVWNPLRSRG